MKSLSGQSGSLGWRLAKKLKHNITQRLLCFCFMVEIIISQIVMLFGSKRILNFDFSNI